MTIPIEVLSRRELEVFHAIAAGEPPKKISERLGLSPKTVSTYRARILRKLGVKSNAELARLEADARLAVAADHTLVAAAICAGVARWEPWDQKRGELIVGAMRHATRLDQAGVPALHEFLRARLQSAIDDLRATGKQVHAA